MSTQNSFTKTAWAGIVCILCLGAAPAMLAQAPGETEASKRGREILSEAAAAAGGEALKEVKSLEFKTTGSIYTPNGPMPITGKVQVSFPDKSRLEMDLGVALITSGFDGKAGWAVTPQGTLDVPADMSPELLRGIDLTGGIGVYQKCLAGKAPAEFGGEKEVAGQKVWQVEWSGPSGKVKLFFDPATKMLVAAKYRAVTMQGVFEEERRWSEFKDVDGVKFPFRWVTYRDGSMFSDQTVTEVKINPAVEAGAFARPQ